MALIRFEHLSFAYPNAKERALDDISLSVSKGEYVVLCGESGCGKTTLLRQGKRELSPAGAREGKVYFNGRLMEECSREETAMGIGFVQQNPDNQIVTDYVWHELAFGLENMALPTQVIRRRVSEIASFFSMEKWFRSKTSDLSGGQKQIMNLAAIMAMDPKLLILDEPTSMLDPLAARNLLDMVERVNRELGVAVLMTEHSLEDVFPVADRVVMMEDGCVAADQPPRKLAEALCGSPGKKRLYFGLPSSARIFSELEKGELPLTIREGRREMDHLMDRGTPLGKNPSVASVAGKEAPRSAPAAQGKKKKPLLSAKELWFRYSQQGNDVLRGLDLSLYPGEMLCLLGGNGAGKSTLLKLLCGVSKPLRGKVRLEEGAVAAMLPQHPQCLFTHDTLLEDLTDSASGEEGRAREMADRLELSHLLGRHPYDLSGGEMQRGAVAKLLLGNANVLLLDEPTKGLDAYAKENLSELLKSLLGDGAAVMVVTHDVEFAAQYADRCAMLFDGLVASEDEPHRFFSGNRFYTTAANRIARDYFRDAVTCQEVIDRCKEFLRQSAPKYQPSL